MKDLVIVGAGGFGRELLEFMRPCFPESEFRVKGFLDQNPNALAGTGVELPILGDPKAYNPEPNDRFLVALGAPLVKRGCVESLLERGATFSSMVHPTAVIASSAELGRGVVIYPYAIVSNVARVGDFVSLNLYASVGHDSTVGDFSSLAPYATLNGGAHVGDEVFMGTHSSLAVTKRIGAKCKISSGAAVMHDVVAESMAFGVPARQVRLGG